MRISEVLSEGITHIEDLPVEQFIGAVRNINLYDISEKIDGTNLHFGLDESGRFFTSRESKGGKRFYNFEEWGDKFWQTGFKSAHLALEKISKFLTNKKLLKLGDQIETEILFGQLPNTVPYSGDTNQIILLRPIAGEDLIDLSNRLDKIKQATEGSSVSVNVPNVPFTDDGKRIEFQLEKHKWRMSQTPQVDKALIDQLNMKSQLEDELVKLENFLQGDSGVGNFTNAEVLGIPLNKKPGQMNPTEWRETKELIKSKKAEVINFVSNIKLNVKETLLDNLVRKVSSEFGPSVEEGGWVEGLVFRDPISNDQFKLVDKDLFTAMNKFNWKIRNLLKSSSAAKKMPDVAGRMLEKLSATIGVPELAKARSANTYLRRIKERGEDPIGVISQSVDFDRTKEQWLQDISHYQKLLDKLYEWYEENKDRLVFKGSFGSNVKGGKYAGEVDLKTKQGFAELRQEMENLQKQVKNAKDSKDLVQALIGERIAALSETRSLKEGGNVFSETGAIHRDEIQPTLRKLAEILNKSLDEINDYVLGSVGKAEFSGDIDLALEDLSDEDKAQLVLDLEQKLGKENVKKVGALVSVNFPIEDFNSNKADKRARTGKVQVDLFFGDREWNKFYFHSAGDKSKFKGVHRNLMLATIAKNMIESTSEERDGFGRPIEQVRFMFSPTKGLVKMKRKSEKNIKGDWKKSQSTDVLTKPTKDPKMIAKLLFGPSANENVFNSLETMIDGVKEHLPEKADVIFADFAKGLPDNVRDFDFPEEIGKHMK
jgi:DNA-binding transcriptional MerR regulator